MFREELIEFILAFLKSRRWWRLLLQGGLLCILPLLVGSFVLYGASIPVESLGNRYIGSVESEVDKRLAAIESGEADAAAEMDSKLRISLERILQLGESNERVSYIVARQLASQGRVETAARKMREIAPANGAGFAPAHAWLAQFERARFDNTKEMAEILLNDLTVANNALSAINPVLTDMQATLLVSFGRANEALDILSFRAQQEPILYAKVADLSALQNDRATLRDAIGKTREFMKTAYAGVDPDEAYYVQHSKLEDYENDLEGVLMFSKKGIEDFPESALLRRYLSNGLLLKFNRVQSNPDEGEPGRDYLQEAYSADPTNPAVTVQIAQAIAQGENTGEELRKALEKQLEDGTASGAAYLILGNSRLGNGDMETGINYLENALEVFPDAPIILNNLAYAMLQLEPPKIDEALANVEKALTFSDIPPAFKASILDTQGEALALKGDILGAIESYEKAIQEYPAKLSSREKLVQLYNAKGMTKMAEVQQERIDELKQ